MEIIRGRLSTSAFSNPSQRYNADTDTFQYTPDNGANWINSPEADMRHSDIFRLPVLETTDPRCDAAANMVKWIKDFIDNVIASLEAEATALTLTNNFLTTFTTLFPPALLLLLLQEAASSLFDTGATAIDDAFTSDQYDLLLCCFFCNLQADGSCTPAGFLSIGGCIFANLNTAAALIVSEILFIQGEVGLSNAGVIGGLTGDCTDCTDCGWCITANFNNITGNFAANHLAGSTASCGFDWGGLRVDGQGWVNAGCVSICISLLLPAGTEITNIAFHGDTLGGTSPAIILNVNSDIQGTNVERYNSTDSGVIDVTLAADTYLALLLQSPSGTACGEAGHNIDSYTISGKGFKPEILVGENC